MSGTTKVEQGDSLHENETDWQRAKACSGGQCIEVKRVGNRILVRDSKRHEDFLSFTLDEWSAFTRGVENGEFRF